MDVFKEAGAENADELIERWIFPCTVRSCQDDTGLAQEIDAQRTRRDLAEKKKSKSCSSTMSPDRSRTRIFSK